MKNIWLIGASEGIGRSLALKLDNDANNFLIISGRNNERLNNLSKELKKGHLVLPFDVTNNDSVINAYKNIKSNGLKVDMLIYCAGYYKPMSSTSIEIEEVEKIIDVNLVSCIRVLTQVVPDFVENQAGHIVLIGSVAGYIGLPNSIGYGSSKAGMISLAETLKSDLDRYKVKVQIINPGFVKTRLTDLNEFKMPSIISSDEAAIYIVKYINKNVFESRFPFLFANLLKIISNLPYWLYFKIASIIAK
jgi:short-subunit dehydrogenase